MTFFKGHHLQRKASDRKQASSLETIVQHRKSESSSSSKSASLSNTDERKGSIEIEVEHLFRQAVDPNSAAPAASSQDARSHNYRSEPSLFLRFRKRQENPTPRVRAGNGLKRAFSHRHNALSTHVEGKSGDDDKVVQSRTPDLVREGSYDSDALFISSPRFSSQSWESLHAFSPLRMNVANAAPPDEKKPEMIVKADSEVIVLPPSSERRQPSHALSVPKRRRQAELSIGGSDLSRSLRRSDITVNNDCLVIGKGSTPAGGVRKKSRFTEMFHHVGLGDVSSSQSIRKVSIGWMSEGKRCGYGYSFVDNDETTTSTSCEGGVFTDGSSEIRAKELNNAQAMNTVDLSIDGEDRHDEDCHDEEDKASCLEIETSNTRDRSSRWTAISSHTRSDRNESANIEDGIIVRDFCTKASPDRPQQEDQNLEAKRHLIANAVRQGFVDTFLWMIGLGKREIARYHAGLDVQAARSRDCQDPMFEMTIPYWDYAPKEELGNYHIEAWRAAKRRSRQLRRPRSVAASSVQESSSLSFGGDEKKYVGRRHSSTF